MKTDRDALLKSSPKSPDTRCRILRHIDNLGSADDRTAQHAERRLIRYGGKAVESLLAAAESADPRVRFRVVWALGKSRDSSVLPVILRLTHDPDDRVAYDAVLALGHLGHPDAIPRLLDLAAHPEGTREFGLPSQTALRMLGHHVREDMDHVAE